MPIPELWVIVLAIGAVARLTRLITGDTITGRLRAKVIKTYGPTSMQAEFIRCPWCVGFWIAAAIVPLAYNPTIVHHPGFYIPASILTVSHLVGVAARWA